MVFGLFLLIYIIPLFRWNCKNFCSFFIIFCLLIFDFQGAVFLCFSDIFLSEGNSVPLKKTAFRIAGRQFLFSAFRFFVPVMVLCSDLLFQVVDLLLLVFYLLLLRCHKLFKLAVFTRKLAAVEVCAFCHF